MNKQTTQRVLWTITLVASAAVFLIFARFGVDKRFGWGTMFDPFTGQALWGRVVALAVAAWAIVRSSNAVKWRWTWWTPLVVAAIAGPFVVYEVPDAHRQLLRYGLGMAMAMAMMPIVGAALSYERRSNEESGTGIMRLLVGAAVVSLVGLTFSQSVSCDEAFSLTLSRHSWADIWNLTARDVHPPLYYWLLHAVLSLCNRMWAVKMFGVVCTLLTAWVLWRERWQSTSARLVTLLAVVGMPMTMAYATDIRMYAPAMLAVTVAYLQAERIWQGEGTWRRWACLALSTACAAWLQNYAAVAVFWVWCLLLVHCIARGQMLRFVVWAAVSVALFAPWLPALFGQLQSVSGSYWIPPLQPVTVQGYLYTAFPGAMILVLALMLRSPRRNELFPLAPFVLTLVLGTAISLAVAPMFLFRYLTPTLPLAWLAVGRYAQRMPSRRPVVVFCVALTAAIGIGLNVWRETRWAIEAQRLEALCAQMSPEAEIVYEGGEMWAIPVQALAVHTDKPIAVPINDGYYESSRLFFDVFPTVRRVPEGYVSAAPEVYYVCRAVGEPLGEFMLTHMFPIYRAR